MELPVKYSECSFGKRRAVKAEYRKVQDNKCYLCKGWLDKEPVEEYRRMEVKPHLYPEGFFKNPVHLHHDHNTDLTLGAVHAHCNAVLWEYYGE